jgi:hypothetical protein
MSVHIGGKIKAKVAEKGVTVTAFAAKIGVSRENAYSIFKRKTIDTGLLETISQVLGYNFFQYYLRPMDAQKKEDSTEIAEFKSQIAILNELLPLLRDLVKKRKG